MSELPLVVGKIVRRLDKCIFSVPGVAKRPYSVTNRLCCKTEKAGEEEPHFKDKATTSPFRHSLSEWDKKLLLWSGRFKKTEDMPEDVSAKTMSGARSKIRVKVAYIAMAFLLLGFVSAIFIGKRNVLTDILHVKELSPEEEITEPYSEKTLSIHCESSVNCELCRHLGHITSWHEDGKKYKEMQTRDMAGRVEWIEETAESASAKP